VIRAALAVLALSTLVLAIACGGDDTPSGTISPIGTKSGAPTASAEPTTANGGPIPAPAEPTLDEAVTLITSGDATAELGPGEIYPFDPQAIAEAAGSTPSCDNFQFDFTWQVQDPYPPANVTLQWQIERSGSDVKVAEGPSGEQSIGCDTIDLVNTGSGTISVAVKYKIGGLGP
jgi:hypothetical protein